ncbi:hypothetical protein E2C01_036315 [Portunus trituberculatus]|uniref:Uncharacterized protein n=1 Tax=Portunus trituberculatus TaxID=210409 RepID=A0A5B7FC49_PORTR|nr:hypothetical protein [Portunus trituberculatus]
MSVSSPPLTLMALVDCGNGVLIVSFITTLPCDSSGDAVLLTTIVPPGGGGGCGDGDGGVWVPSCPCPTTSPASCGRVASLRYVSVFTHHGRSAFRMRQPRVLCGPPSTWEASSSVLRLCTTLSRVEEPESPEPRLEPCVP